jgi:hypothetical protein
MIQKLKTAVAGICNQPAHNNLEGENISATTATNLARKEFNT